MGLQVELKTVSEFFDNYNAELSKIVYSLTFTDPAQDLAKLEEFSYRFGNVWKWEHELLYPAALRQDMNKFSTAVRNIREEMRVIKEHLDNAIIALKAGDLGLAHKHHHFLKSEFTDHNGRKEFALYLEFEDFPPEVVAGILQKVLEPV